MVSLTQIALGYGISQFVALGKTFVLQRLRQFEAIQSAIETDTLGSPGFPPTENEVNKFLEELEHQPPTSVERQLVRHYLARFPVGCRKKTFIVETFRE